MRAAVRPTVSGMTATLIRPLLAFAAAFAVCVTIGWALAALAPAQRVTVSFDAAYQPMPCGPGMVFDAPADPAVAYACVPQGTYTNAR